jgi:hypothetical protein
VASAMSHPRFSTSALMAVVLVVAVDLAAGDAGYIFPGIEWPELLNYGARPMACILAVGWIVLLKAGSGGAGKRPFLAGFEAFGAVALFSYIACARLFTQSIHAGVGDLAKGIVSSGSFLFAGYLKTLFLLPQLLVALLGGWQHSVSRHGPHRTETGGNP